MFPPLALWKAALILTPSEETEAWRCEVSPRGTPLYASFCVGDKIVPSQGTHCHCGRPQICPSGGYAQTWRQLQVGEVEEVPQPPLRQDLEVGLPQVSRQGQCRNQAQSHRATEPPPCSSLCPQAKILAYKTATWAYSRIFLPSPHFPTLPESTSSAPFSPSSAHPPPHPCSPATPTLPPLCAPQGRTFDRLVSGLF